MSEAPDRAVVDSAAADGQSRDGKLPPQETSKHALFEDILPQAASAGARRHPRFGTRVTSYNLLAFEDVAKALEPKVPVFARVLRHYGKDRVCSAFDTKQRVWAEVEKENEQQRKLADERNPGTEQRIKEFIAEREPGIKDLKKKLDDARDAKDQAEKNAGTAFGKAGGIYNPKDIDASVLSLFAYERETHEMAASDLKLPYSREPFKALMHQATWWLFNILSGVVGGVSLGLAVGMLRRNDLALNPGTVALWAFGGLGIFTTYRYLVKAALYQYSEASYLGMPRRWLLGALALIQLAIAISVWVAVDGNGLMRAASTGPSSQPVPVIVSYLVACVLSFGPFLYSANEGLVRGRVDPVNNEVTARVQTANRHRAEARRSGPNYEAAVTAFVETEVARRNYDLAETEYIEANQSYNAELEALKAEIIHYPVGPSVEQTRRMQHASDQHEWAVVETDAILATILAKIRQEELAIEGLISRSAKRSARPWWRFWSGI